MLYEFDKATIDITKIGHLVDSDINRYGFEVRPKDGTPYHSGYIDFFSAKAAAKTIYDVYLQGNLSIYQKQY